MHIILLILLMIVLAPWVLLIGGILLFLSFVFQVNFIGGFVGGLKKTLADHDAKMSGTPDVRRDGATSTPTK